MDTELHEGSLVGSEHHSEHVERISSVSDNDSVKGNLAADKVDEETNEGPDNLVLEANLRCYENRLLV